jgi:hypothetical protein
MFNVLSDECCIVCMPVRLSVVANVKPTTVRKLTKVCDDENGV